MAMAHGDLTAWVTVLPAGAALRVVAIVLFVISETPARRLGQLIEAWRGPSGPVLPPSSGFGQPLTGRRAAAGEPGAAGQAQVVGWVAVTRPVEKLLAAQESPGR
ncbi:hypothetical protein SGFS_003650 [Streptomyces graminofaciens]|uniref:Uncharacterized protein n=2 Tax=Streptomyces graminofaciens TaxID=68212 RepID=A0ABN5V758_9ACTN|nr:hypothetical protein SGFS_003650 [Streptomyces graminofaciens]